MAIIETDANNPADVARIVAENCGAFVAYDVGDGERLFVKITDEGLILDLETSDGEVIATWGATSDELREMTH